MSKSSRHCHGNPILVPPYKPPYPVLYIYEGQTFDLKTRVDKWMGADVVSLKYGTLAHMSHLMKYFLRFDTGIAYRCDGAMWCIVDIFVWIIL